MSSKNTPHIVGDIDATGLSAYTVNFLCENAAEQIRRKNITRNLIFILFYSLEYPRAKAPISFSFTLTPTPGLR
jgi:hypothetical protein